MSDQLTSALTLDGAYRYDTPAADTSSAGYVVKSVIDLSVAGLSFLVLLPLFILVAILVKLDGGPIFFAHSRIGRRGRSFKCYKFRSMRTNSDDLLANMLLSDPEAAEEWKTKRKLRNDPRITPIGKILRKTSLDELPQLLNVLKMDMSLVGPRPIVDQELHLYGAEIHKYCSFRPGITGLWQVSGRSETTFSRRVEFDVKYTENWSVWLDLKIIAKTVPTVIWGSGAR
jgi:Undecaprenyl-phosphate galactose phosphotransferase WbaP